MSATYDVAQICLNGHMVNSTWASSPEFSKDFCPKCGTRTITECQACKVRIQGHCHITGFISARPTSVRAYCHACGKPYPWTSARIEAARAIAQELDGLSDAERISLQASIDDLVADTPRTEVAVVRFKKLAAKAGKHGMDALKNVLVNVVSEAAKRQLWP